MANPAEPKTDTIAETENYLAWRADEPLVSLAQAGVAVPPRASAAAATPQTNFLIDKTPCSHQSATETCTFA